MTVAAKTSPSYLPALLTILAVASLAGACTLDALGKPDASQAWTAFLAFSSALLGVHIPAPSQS